jgi:uncharacterized protein YbjT (DUF2867 family)
MKVPVIGDHGFLGAHLVVQLKSAGHPPAAGSRRDRLEHSQSQDRHIRMSSETDRGEQTTAAPHETHWLIGAAVA